MAKIVFGAGTSHSPMLALPASDWVHRSESDYLNKALNLSDGRFLTYDALLAEVGPIRQQAAELEHLKRQEAVCQAALDHLADALEAAAPDVVLIVGDDQEELFGTANQPALSIFYGDEIAMNDKLGREGNPRWIKDLSPGYLMDRLHRHPGHRAVALALIDGLLERSIDVSSSSHVENPQEAGFGHAFGFVIKRLFKGKPYPVVPVLLNTYYPPNVLRPARCYDVGRAIRGAVEAMPDQSRVAIIASGGLSHFVTDAALDRRVLEGLRRDKRDLLRAIPTAALNSGSSEILNWIVMAGAAEELSPVWDVYEPIYRTPAGTGTGLAFAILK